MAAVDQQSVAKKAHDTAAAPVRQFNGEAFSTTSLNVVAPEIEEVRKQITAIGAERTFYLRLAMRDSEGALMALTACPSPIRIDSSHITNEIREIGDPRIIDALIAGGTPLLSEPELYLEVIRIERFLGEGEDPKLVRALLKNGLGPCRMEGALTLACEAIGRYSDPDEPTGFGVVELLLAAGADVDEREASPLRLAIECRNLQLTQTLCGGDKYGAAIRRVSFKMGALGAQGTEDLQFLLQALTPARRYEALEHALKGGVDKPEAFVKDLINLGARGHRRPPNYNFPRDLVSLLDREPSPSDGFMEQALYLESVNPPPHARTDPLSERIKASDIAAVRLLMESDISLRNAQSRPVELAAYHGEIAILKYFIEELGLDVNENNGSPLIVASGEGWVDVLKYLISKGADARAQKDAPLFHASWHLNAEVVRILIEKGADIRVDNEYPVYNCAINSEPEKRGPALETAKHLVEHGANPRVFGLPLDLHKGPAPVYLYLMSEAMDPRSSLYVQSIDSRLTSEYINFKAPNYHRSHVFKYISNCAAVAASLGDISIARDFFESFLRDGAQKVFTEKKGSFKDLAVASSREIEGYQNLEDIGQEFALQVLLPAIAAQSPQIMERESERARTSDILDAATRFVYPDAVRILFKDRSLLDVLRYNKLWHRADKRLPIEANSLRSNVSWYPLVPDTKLSNGYSIHSLTDLKALEREGSALHHCVGNGGYAAACLAGESHVLSLRLNSEPVATVQFIDSIGRESDFRLSNGRFVALHQFRGAYNDLPEPGANRALMEFLNLVRSKLTTLGEQGLGETADSIAFRQISSVSTIEAITGVRLHEFPRAAFLHYRETLSILPTKGSADFQRRGTPLLRLAEIQVSPGTTRAFFNQLAHVQTLRSGKWSFLPEQLWIAAQP